MINQLFQLFGKRTQRIYVWFKPIIEPIFFFGNARTVRARKNIFALLILRGISLLTGFLIVPLTLHYLTPTKYGIWLTISSIVGWFTFFDIGLGNGFRNKFAEAKAKNDFELARMYVSTTYAILTLVMIVLFLVFVLINPLLNWSSLLNAPRDISAELSMVVGVTFFFFCFRFIFGLIGTVLVADQQPASNSVIDVCGNILSLAIIWLLIHTTQSSLLSLSIGLGACTGLVPVGASIILFSSKYRHLRPSMRYVQFSHAKELMNLGVKFFILQISALIIFSSSNIIIIQLFSPAEVIPYNIAFKYFNIVSMVFYLVLLPFWSAYTEAFTRGDIPWIQRTLGVLRRLWFLSVVIVILMSFFANTFYRIWVGREIHIPIAISIAMGIYVLIIAWSSIYSNFINGTGIIRMELVVSIIAGIVNIPLAIVFSKYMHMGIPGIILAPCICLLPGCIVWPMQVKKILSGKATGIWGMK